MSDKECSKKSIDENEANDGFVDDVKEDVNEYYVWDMIPVTYPDDKKTGVSFKGDRVEYIEAHGMLTKMMDKKGSKFLVNGREFQILDNAKNKPIKVEIKPLKGPTGKANLKIYNVNKNGYATIMVQKVSDGTLDHVKALAFKVVKYLLDGFLDGEITTVDIEGFRRDSCDNESPEILKCKICGKCFKTKHGMNIHEARIHSPVIMKMHQNNEGKQKEEHKVTKDEHDQIISNEAKKVVNDIINNLIYIEDEEGAEDSSVTLGEISGDSSDLEGEKEYCNVCDKCDYKIVANRKYVAVQLLLDHKNEHHIKNCSECEYKAHNLQDMKRHGRDVHGIKTASTSPPKRKRKLHKEESDNSVRMDIDDKNVLNMNSDIEEMEVEIQNDTIFEKRRDQMDAKVKAKQERMEEEERKRNVRKKAIEKEKNAEKLANIEQSRKLNKSRKVKHKSMKKVINKKKKKLEEQAESETKYRVPNIKEVPQCCQHLVNQGDVVFVVPGDGACGPNCASAFFFHDEVFGPKLRKRMNQFFVKHWRLKYKSLSPCSEDDPFERMTKYGPVRYTDPEELFKFLLSDDQKASYMWTDGEDLVVIADMYQVNIKIVTMKSTSDIKPTVNWVYADKSMEDFAELKNVDQNDMVLLHENDSHFNLIIAGDSDLAKLGSLSYRFNVGPVLIETQDDKEVVLTGEDEDASEEIVTSNLKRELKKCREEKKKLQVEYFSCEKELRKKTEEAEMLKSELKDLKEIMKLENLLKKQDRDESKNDEEEKSRSADEELLLKMKQSGFQRKSPQYEPSKLNQPRGIAKEKQYNCSECDFQGTKQLELNKHINIKHRVTDVNDGTIVCRNCGEQFTSKWNLMTHRKSMHSNTVAFCRNKREDKCDYSDDMCWWRHDAESMSSAEEIKCFVCGKTFESKPEMMKHRKKMHSQVIMPCTQFQINKCRFQDERCWFKHEVESDQTDDSPKPMEEENPMETESVFQKVTKNQEPPLSTNQRTAKN